MNLSDLRKPFDPKKISWRVGSTTKDKAKGMALAYIDARDVQDRLDEVCGTMGWQNRYIPMHDKKTVCEIGIYSEALGAWVWKADGAGDSDVEAEKGALSDAFKRAAVKWGIGRYLYDLDSPWVELDTYEKNGATFAKGIKQSEYTKLHALLSRGLPKEDDTRPEADNRRLHGFPVRTEEPNPRAILNVASKPTGGPPYPPPKMTPAEEWASTELAIIRAAPTPVSLKAWEMQHDTKMKKLKLVDPGLYDAMLAAVDARAKALLV